MELGAKPLWNTFRAMRDISCVAPAGSTVADALNAADFHAFAFLASVLRVRGKSRVRICASWIVLESPIRWAMRSRCSLMWGRRSMLLDEAGVVRSGAGA